MADSATLLADLKFRAGVQDAEGITDGQLDALIESAIIEHNPNQTVGTLPTMEGILVVYLAWAMLCEVRAAKFSLLANQSSSSGFGQDRNTPYYKCMDLAATLRKRYAGLCSSMNISVGATAPVMSSLSNILPEADALTPEGEEPALPIVVLKLADGESTTTGTTYVLQWVMMQFSNFLQFELYHIVGSDPIYQTWNWESTVFSTTPQVNDSATLISTITNESTRGVKVTGLTKSAGVTNRFLLVVKSQSGGVGYSNELAINYNS